MQWPRSRTCIDTTQYVLIGSFFTCCFTNTVFLTIFNMLSQKYTLHPSYGRFFLAKTIRYLYIDTRAIASSTRIAPSSGNVVTVPCDIGISPLVRIVPLNSHGVWCRPRHGYFENDGASHEERPVRTVAEGMEESTANGENSTRSIDKAGSQFREREQ